MLNILCNLIAIIICLLLLKAAAVHADQSQIIKQWTDLKCRGDEKVSITLSKEAEGYVVCIKINKKCGPVNTVLKGIFTDPKDVAMVTDYQIGPDEIIVQLEGNTLQTQIALSIDNCGTYKAAFQVPVGGIYALKVVRLRQNYDAIKYEKIFPKMRYEKFLDEVLEQSLVPWAPQPCSPETPNIKGYWVSNSTRVLENNEKIVIKEKCSHNDERRGLKLDTRIPLTRAFKRDHCAYDMELYNWNQKICDPDYDPEIDLYGTSVSSKIGPVMINHLKWENIRKKKILFVGDSHTRGLSEIFLYHVCDFAEHNLLGDSEHSDSSKNHQIEIPSFKNEPTVINVAEKTFRKSANTKFKLRSKKQRSQDYVSFCEKYPKDSDCNLFHPRCEDVTFTYMAAYFCNTGILPHFKDYDYIILNCGHHAAAHSHYDFQLYKNTVARMIDGIETDKSINSKKYFWIESVAIPLHQDDGVIKYQDWRTYHRLHLYNALAENVIRASSLSIHVIPAFQSTMSLFDKMCDCGHYPSSSRIPILMELLDAISTATSGE